MKAAYIEQTGGPENINFGNLPDPVPDAGEVLVRVGAAPVNPIDTYVRAGMVAAELPGAGSESPPLVAQVSLADVAPVRLHGRAGKDWGSRVN